MAASASPRQYDVFLSFRGIDTRKKFVSYLYRELQSKGITIFKDDRDLHSGDSLSDELPKAIKESKFAVVVISENYASSRWCLNELQMIMELKKKGALEVVPIFYDVDPSDVRNQRGSFAEYLQKHEAAEKAEKVIKWREALTAIADLTGVDSRGCPEEATMVCDIARDISERLFSMSPKDSRGIIGMDTHLQALHPLLSMGSDNKVRMIGIWGMGGVGKTTIAKHLYDNLSCQFPFHCFIENIKKINSEGGLEHLRRKFLSKILKDETLMSSSVEVGPEAIKERLSGRKVLAILDDVDNLEPLEALAKEDSWFGPRSRIIITMRDMSFLISRERRFVYEVKCLEHNAARSFFNHFAFSGAQVPEDFKSLAVRASELARGLPIALKVLGLYLRGRKINEWDAAVERLRENPRKAVMTCLKVSYYDLTEENQGIFLTVACFFNEEHASRVSKLLVVSGGESVARDILEKLAEKSLIGISDDGKLIVHDLIRDMAKEIANREHGRPRFLVDSDVDFEELAAGTRTDAIEGISLRMHKMPNFPFGSKGFENMPNLRYLKISGSFWERMPTNISHLPRGLRSLIWDDCPLTNLPPTFRGECLVELCLRPCRIEKLLQGTLSLQNLRRLTLNCARLKETLVLNVPKKLEELYLGSCSNLVKFPSSFLLLEKLTTVSLSFCKNLEFPPSVAGLKSLKVVELRSCPCLKSIPELPRSVVVLNMSYTSIREVPDSIRNLVALEILDLGGCKELLEISSRIGNLTALKTLNLSGCRKLLEVPNSIGNLRSLKKLHLRGCESLDRLPDSVWNLTELENLNLLGLFEIPSSIENFQSAKELTLWKCENLKNIPDIIGNLTALSSLSLLGCKMLSEIPSSIGNLQSVKKLCLRDCKNLRSIPDTIGGLTALESLYLEGCSKLSNIPSTIGNLTALEFLNLSGCKMLLEIPSTIGDLTNLRCCHPPEDVNCVFKILNAFCCGKQHFETSKINKVFFPGVDMKVYCERGPQSHAIEVLSLMWTKWFSHFGEPIHCTSLSIFPRLRKLSLCNLNIQEISDDLGCLQALQSLDLRGNIFEVLPESVKQLTLLEELVLNDCVNLRIMPELPQGVKYLYAKGCCSLESVSNVSRHPFLQLLLKGCFKLGEDVPLLIRHMISMPFHTEEVNAWACISASGLPDCFYHRRKGQNITICCPQTDSNLKPIGFVAGVVVDRTYTPGIFRSGIQCHWQCKGFLLGQILEDFKSLHFRTSFCGSDSDILFVFSYNFGEEKSCDRISFHFDIDFGRTCLFTSHPKIKGCGIHLCLTEESQRTQTLLT